ncbi:Sin3 associated polypeptide p18 (SAP18) [Microdochium nivale]|nr:Sin3 associated polypeptide p18 (SAP18) [Microdochium nivale]
MDRQATPPFMLRLFYRTGAFHRPDEFNVGDPAHLPQHLILHTWPDCTLTELSHHLAAATPTATSQPQRDGEAGSSGQILPAPAIGTRLVFRLIFASFPKSGNDNKSNSLSSSGAPHRGRAGPRGAGGDAKFNVKDLGSVVIGEGGRGLDVSNLDNDSVLDKKDGGVGADRDRNQAPLQQLGEGSDDGLKTLSEARLVPGDYISCAILPPLEEDGSVAPASSARAGRGLGAGEARAVGGGGGGGEGRQQQQHPASSLSAGRRVSRDHDWDRPAGGGRYRDDGGGYGQHGGRRRGGGGVGYDGRGGGGGGADGREGGFGTGQFGDRGTVSRGVPAGEWRRGETLPAVPRGDWRRGDDAFDGPPSRSSDGRERW